MNQYTTVGDTTYVFDADGNLIEERARRWHDHVHLQRRKPARRLSRQRRRHVAIHLRRPGQPRGHDRERRDHPLRHRPHRPGQRRRRVRRRRQPHRPLRPRLRPDLPHGAAGGPAYYTFDAIGSTRQLVSATGTVATATSTIRSASGYKPASRSPTPSSTSANSALIADGDGLYFMRARQYHEKIGRFTAADPINLAGHDINLYRYAAMIRAAD